jgi:TatD DNase family protein
MDTHVHLTDRRFDADRPAVADRARSAGLIHLVVPGITARDSADAVALARQWAGVHPAVAIHPNEWGEASSGDWATVEDLARSSPEVVAIGETGLDRHWDRTPFDAQVDAFHRHLDLAESLGLPVILHARDCFPDMIGQLERRGTPVRGVLHSFTGHGDDARAILELGLHISFAGMITFTSKALDPLRAVAATVPLERLLVETDAPYLAPHPHRGRRNEPAHVVLTAQTVATARGMSLGELARATTANAIALFGLQNRARLACGSDTQPEAGLRANYAAESQP